ncbi:MAG: hypothetical protein J5883_04615, partial [Clostridiales bacterium]|nr:hypothetical protein [Clostridiales bacterium]
MMKSCLKTSICYLIALLMVFSSGICVLADGDDEQADVFEEEGVSEETEASEEEIPVASEEDDVQDYEEPSEEIVMAEAVDEEEVADSIDYSQYYVSIDDMTASEYGPNVHRTNFAHPSACIPGIVEVTFDDTSSQDILDLINQYRYEACVNGYPDPRNPSRNLTEADYKPVYWSRCMEEIAMIRTVEAQYAGATHTTLTNFMEDVTYTRYFERRVSGECLHFSPWDTSILEGLQSFYNERSSWIENNSINHYSIMINPDATLVGAAAAGGTMTVEFSDPTDPSRDVLNWPCIDTSKVDVSSFDSQLLEIGRGYISDVYLTCEDDTDLFFMGEEYQFIPMAKLKHMGLYGNAPLVRMCQDSWTSSDPTVASIDQYGNLMPLSEGTVTITCDLNGSDYTRTITIRPAKTPGWLSIDGYHYYLDEDLNVLTGWQIIDGDPYYFDDTGKRISGEYTIGSVIFVFDDEGVLQTGFQERNGNTYYVFIDDEGCGSIKTGWADIGEETYYFDKNGSMYTGYKMIDGIYYGFDESTGALLRSCFHMFNNKKYYFDDNGQSVSLANWVLINGAWYYNGNLRTGWQYIGNDWYYLDPSGVPYKGSCDIDGKKYLFDENGIGLFGWQTVDGVLKYFDKTNGMGIGWLTIDDKDYYFDDNGVFYTGTQVIGGKTYLFNDDGSLYKGWKRDGGYWYYYSASGMQTGFGYIEGKTYYFDASGKMKTGWVKVTNGYWYYFDKSGASLTGIIEINGSWYYISPYWGMLTGWQYNEDYTERFYFLSNGKRATGWTKIDDDWYYFDSKGHYVTGWKKLSGKWYYFSDKGKMTVGWLSLNDKRYYFDGSGAMASSGWKKIDSFWHYFESSGAVAEGWKKIGDKWYYFRGYYGEMMTGWFSVDGKVYYANSSGVLQIGWIKVGN